MVNDITAVIRTIGRPTLNNAIESAKREFNHVIVVADAVDLKDKVEGITYLRTGQKFGVYGGACINMAAYATKTEYFCLLDDDDEYLEGAGELMRLAVNQSPDVSIWIPGLVYNDGTTICISAEQGVNIGNIAVPTYRTQLLWDLPFSSSIGMHDPACVDFYHVQILHSHGAKVGWYNNILYNVRPKLDGRFGSGQ